MCVCVCLTLNGTFILCIGAFVSNLSVFAHLQGFGVADTDNCACPPCCYNVSVSMDKNKSTEIVHNLKVLISIMEIVLMVDFLCTYYARRYVRMYQDWLDFPMPMLSLCAGGR